MKRTHCWIVFLAIGAGIVFPSTASAGMPALIGDDIVQDLSATGLQQAAIARLQSISFFLLGFLLSAGLIKLIWNFLRRDWTFLPKLTYGKAVGIVFLWGVLFILVLTMISGARELLTPGAWEKQGVTYRLPQAAPAPPDTNSPEKLRKERLAELRAALWNYAAKHKGQFPDDLAAAGVSEQNRCVPDPSQMPYVYVKGLAKGGNRKPVVCEPEIFGTVRFALYTNGDIIPVNSAEVRQMVSINKP